MKKLIAFALVLVLSLGVLGACFGGQQNNQLSDRQLAGLSPSDIVLRFADLLTADDTAGLTQITDLAITPDPAGYTFVSTKNIIQNPDAQMEPFEIEYYKNLITGITDTAIVCVHQIDTYVIDATNQQVSYDFYVDYYLVKTRDKPFWRIVAITEQAGQ